MKKRFLTALILIAALFVVGCTPDANAPGGGAAPGGATPGGAAPPTETQPGTGTAPEATQFQRTVTIGVSTDMPSNMPFGDPNIQTSIMTYSTFNELVRVDTSDWSVHPELAHSWEHNADSSVFTFFLRDDVVFHNGEPFTAEDVKFTFEFATNQANEGINFPIQGGALIEEIVAVDAHTVTFYLNRPVPDWLFYANAKILSAPTVERYGIMEGGVIGTGPFYFVEHVPGISWTVRRFDNYWGELPVTEEKTWVVIADASARSLSLEAGDVDVIFNVATTDIPGFKANPNVVVYQAPGINNLFLGINNSRPAGSDLRIRQAIAHAVNRDDIVGAVFEGGAVGSPAWNFISTVSQGYATVDPIPFDVEASRAILAEAGFGPNNRLTLELYVFALHLPTAEVLQHSLGQSYFDVNITEWSQSGFTANIMADGGYDLMINGSSSVGGTMNIINRFFTTTGVSNPAFFHNEWLDSRYQDAMNSATYEEMIAIYAEIQQFLAYQVPYVPLVQQYLWAVGSSGFSGAYLGNQSYTVTFANARVALN